MADPVLRPAPGRAAGLLAADIIIANAPDPVFVADLGEVVGACAGSGHGSCGVCRRRNQRQWRGEREDD